MPTMRVTTTNIPALGQAFPLAGQQYEYMPFKRQRVEIAIVANAAGIIANVYSGSDLLQQSGAVTVKATPIVYPDDYQITDVSGFRERLSIELRETANVATTDIDTSVILTPVA